MKQKTILIILWIHFVFAGFTYANSDTVTLEVTATAYTTDGGLFAKKALGAWGDEMKPGMKVIAVSRDLLAEGLTHKTKVRIEGLMRNIWS